MNLGFNYIFVIPEKQYIKVTSEVLKTQKRIFFELDKMFFLILAEVAE